MRLIKIIDKLLDFIVIMFFITVISFSAYALYDINQVYNDAKLADDILKYRPEEQVEGEAEKFNLADLQKEINEDICGWLRVDGTNIDYPILYPDTSLEYLDKDYKREYSPAGSIFIDTKNDRLFEDDYTVIYGHNMAEKRMFSDIKEFQDVDFFKNHSTGKLYTADKVYNIKIYSYNVLDSNTDIAYKVMQYSKGKNAVLVENFIKSAINRRDFEISSDDKLAILTTCNGAGTALRSVLVCVLEESSSSIGTINENSNSDIEKDKKLDDVEKQKNEKKVTTIKNKDELSKKNKSKKKYNAEWDRRWYYIKRDLRDPVKLSLYILVLITISIYVVVIVKKIKKTLKKKYKQKQDVMNIKEEINVREKRLKEQKIKDKKIKQSKVKPKKMNARDSKPKRKGSSKGKHSL